MQLFWTKQFQQFSFAICISLSASLFMMHSVSAAVSDLRIMNSSISFSTNDFVAGDEIRIYATVQNVGEEDVTGYVGFYHGSVPIGNSQVISVRAGGVPEEVFVDFIIPSGEFNISARILGTEPVDANTSNDTAISTLIYPILDDDRDGIENADDNCPASSNASQQDFDGDGEGDDCDPDDDNDGRTDIQEANEGTNPKDADSDNDGLDDGEEAQAGTDPNDNDSDNDGVSDSVDINPLQAPVIAPPPAPVVPEPVVEVVEEEAVIALSEDETLENPLTNILESVSQSVSEIINEEEGSQQEDQSKGLSQVAISPNALFSYTQNDWRTYAFSAQVPDTFGFRTEWDFGDGVTSNEETVEHTYHDYGDFLVLLKVIDSEGNISVDSHTITVSFFTLQNRIVKLLVGILIISFVLGIIASIRGGKPTRSKEKKISVRKG